MAQHKFDTFIPVDCQSRYNLLLRAKRDGQWWMLKGLKKEYANDAVMLELLRKEFQLGMMLRHQGVVAFVSLEQVPEMGGTFIVQEWVEGVTLKQWLTSNHSTSEKVNVLLQLCDVLSYCHSMNVVHRDIKPSNIMITPSHQVVLIDFGLALAGNQAIFRAPAGTKQYMAPEQSDETVVVDGRADLYAVGGIMQDMKLPCPYQGVMRSLLERDPNRRPPNALELRKTLIAESRKQSKLVRWISLMTIVGLCIVGAYRLGSTPLGYHLFGTSNFLSPKLPDYLTRDTANHWAADTSRYITLVKGDSIRYSVPKTMTEIPGKIDEHEAVDLGLSVLWAPFNVGCDRSNLSMPGGYYGYGEPSGVITSDNPANINMYWTSYHGDYSGTEYDIAYEHWGERWRTPRKTEFDELIAECQWTLVKPACGPAGYLVIGPNGNRIFLPMAGFRYGGEYYEIGTMGFYWMTVPEGGENESGVALRIQPEGLQIISTIANNGFSVRPVRDR